MGGSKSIAFDRAADFYDATRRMDPHVMAEMVGRLAAELVGRGKCLEVGVGTGLIALPLAELGIPLAGLDISIPMLRKLIHKSGGRPPFPLVIGDAASLPFPTHAFDAGLVRWVFHLVPDWETVARELVRVVRPGGVVLVHLGGFTRTWTIVDRFLDAAGGVPFAVGLDPRRPELLDSAFALHGGRLRLLPAIRSRDETTVRAFLDEMEAGMHSWTWRVAPEVRATVLPGLRKWAEEAFGSLDEPLEPDLQIVWRAYDVGE